MTLPTSTRTGYTFNGWYTAASGGTKVNSITIPINGQTVYAQWTKLPGLSGQALSVGREVTLGGEKFYVIEDSPASNGNVKLISKFNLNTAGSSQQNASYSTTDCVFSSYQYWDGDSENLNKDFAPAGSAYQKAKAYGAAKGGTGRLMTYAEATALQSKNTNVLYGLNIGATDNYLRYWLGESHSFLGFNGDVSFAYGDQRFIGYSKYGNSVACGVRAVVEVSKSKIT